MMDFKFLHLCNHVFKSVNPEGEIREIEVIHEGEDLIDLVIGGAVLLGIMEVRVIEVKPFQKIDDFLYDNNKKLQTFEDVDSEDGYFDDAEGFIVDFSPYFKGVTPGNPSNPIPTEYYEPYLHNRIKWNVNPPIKYLVKGKVLFHGGNKKTYPMNECPRCQGNGWFVDILNQDGKFEESSGLSKIAQTIIKDFLTKLGSSVLDRDYGTLAHEQLALSNAEDNKMFDDLRLIVSEVEDKYLSKQASNLSNLNPDEILVALRINDVYRPTPQSRKIVMELKIITMVSNGLFRIAY
jgi:hypothetical protein